MQLKTMEGSVGSSTIPETQPILRSELWRLERLPDFACLPTKTFQLERKSPMITMTADRMLSKVSLGLQNKSRINCIFQAKRINKNLEQWKNNNCNLRGARYLAPPKKYLLHDGEMLSVPDLRHFESLHHVMYFFCCIRLF